MTLLFHIRELKQKKTFYTHAMQPLRFCYLAEHSLFLGGRIVGNGNLQSLETHFELLHGQ